MIIEMEWVSINFDGRAASDWETRSRVDICFI